MTIKSYFRSSGYIKDCDIQSSQGMIFSIGELPGFLRTLLVTDGTVTKILEAWFWEPVVVVPSYQNQEPLKDNLEALNAEKGANCLRREVFLKGKNSSTNYAHAHSVLLLDNLPPRICKGMLEGSIGIGEILREQGIETYREIIALDFLKQSQAHTPAQKQMQDDLVSRSYRIHVGGKPAILVTEYFPLKLYQ